MENLDTRLPATDASNLPILAMPGLEGNEPTRLKGLQIPMEPYLDLLMLGWWIAIAATFAYLVTRFLVRPLLQQRG